MHEWIDGHAVLLGWLFAASLAVFLGSLAAVPWIIVRLPADYFTRRRRMTDRWRSSHPALRWFVPALKNLCGVLLVMAGLVMLFTPGQGLLTLFVGLLFLDFPGKPALEQWVIRRRAVCGVVQWMRRKAGRMPLDLPPRSRPPRRPATPKNP